MSDDIGMHGQCCTECGRPQCRWCHAPWPCPTTRLAAAEHQRDEAREQLAKAEALSDVREAILTCYWFALAAISAADKDDGHDEHEDCPGAVADASIQTARKLYTDHLASTPAAVAEGKADE